MNHHFCNFLVWVSDSTCYFENFDWTWSAEWFDYRLGLEEEEKSLKKKSFQKSQFSGTSQKHDGSWDRTKKNLINFYLPPPSNLIFCHSTCKSNFSLKFSFPNSPILLDSLAFLNAFPASKIESNSIDNFSGTWNLFSPTSFLVFFGLIDRKDFL